ncbi:Cationic peroxidase 1 [Camellia lanceoleosa]|uniref:Cationic peroxidase 1 n=1 Tax=Camellia lanceoleosa TaxID=1840588 RepID=A0ACC0GCM0_9ERIC|nr:Cationic peroxidase 1 [Camellia lanceoleosa]
MDSCSSKKPITLCLGIFLFLFLVGMAYAQLSSNFYSSSCPKLFPIIRAEIDYIVSKDKRMVASLLRLHFHDCFVNGCDASILLDDTETFNGEKTAPPNFNSLRGYDLIDTIKLQVETLCPGVVSCADILAIVARDAVVSVGGPSWSVELGRRDSTTANFSAPSTDIPAPDMNLSALTAAFAKKGFTFKEMVALTGSHTIGQARCLTFQTRINNEPNIDSQFAASLRANCSSNGDLNILFPLDTTTPMAFDNAYFKNLQSQKGLLHSDQQLFSGGYADRFVNTYSSNSTTFFSDFASAMVKMGNLNPLTGTSGEIRTNCRKINAHYVYELVCSI